jgi:hypothetical protein
LRKLRFSVRTWYAAKNRDTDATLTIKGRMIFRVVRIMTPQFSKMKSGRGGWAGGRMGITIVDSQLLEYERRILLVQAHSGGRGHDDTNGDVLACV